METKKKKKASVRIKIVLKETQLLVFQILQPSGAVTEGLENLTRMQPMF